MVSAGIDRFCRPAWANLAIDQDVFPRDELMNALLVVSSVPGRTVFVRPHRLARLVAA